MKAQFSDNQLLNPKYSIVQQKNSEQQLTPIKQFKEKQQLNITPDKAMTTALTNSMSQSNLCITPSDYSQQKVLNELNNPDNIKSIIEKHKKISFDSNKQALIHKKIKIYQPIGQKILPQLDLQHNLLSQSPNVSQMETLTSRSHATQSLHQSPNFSQFENPVDFSVSQQKQKDNTNKFQKHYRNQSTSNILSSNEVSFQQSQIDNNPIGSSSNRIQLPSIYNKNYDDVQFISLKNNNQQNQQKLKFIKQQIMIKNKYSISSIQNSPEIKQQRSFFKYINPEILNQMPENVKKDLKFLKMALKSSLQSNTSILQKKCLRKLQKGIFPNMKNSNFLADQIENEDENEEQEMLQRQDYKTRINEVQQLLGDLKESLINSNKQQIINYVNTICDKAHKIGEDFPIFHLKALSMQGKILRDLGDFKKSIFVFNQQRIYCNIYKEYKYKLLSYRHIIEIHQMLQNHKKALIFLAKLLKLAWKLKDTEYELLAYDMIGLNYYYLGKIQEADYFHNRAVQDTKEPHNSIARKVGEEAINLRDDVDKGSGFTSEKYFVFNTDSEDDYILESLQINDEEKQRARQTQLTNIGKEIKKKKFPIPKILKDGAKQCEYGKVDDPTNDPIIHSPEQFKIVNQQSVNRNIQNFFVYNQNNSAYWIFDEEWLDKIKNYNLDRNLRKYKQDIDELITNCDTINFIENIKYQNVFK